MSSLAHGGGALNNGLTHRLGMLERMTGMKIVSTVGEAKTAVRKAPVVPEIRDFRVWRRREITTEEASKLEWRVCDAEWDYSAFFKLRHPETVDTENDILVTMRTSPGVPTHAPTGGWYFYGTHGTLVGRGGHILSPITKHVGETREELPVPEALTDDLPRIGDDIQNKWVALVRDFLADIEDPPTRFLFNISRRLALPNRYRRNPNKQRMDANSRLNKYKIVISTQLSVLS